MGSRSLSSSVFSALGQYRLSHLASVCSLREVCLEHVKAFDAATATEIGLLAVELGRNRQDVQFHVFHGRYRHDI